MVKFWHIYMYDGAPISNRWSISVVIYKFLNWQKTTLCSTLCKTILSVLLHKTTLGNIFTNSLVTFQVSIPGFQVFLFNIVSALYIFCRNIFDASRNLFLSSSFLIAMNHVSYRPYLNKTIKQFLVFLHRESLKKINLCWNQNFTGNSSTRKWVYI